MSKASDEYHHQNHDHVEVCEFTNGIPTCRGVNLLPCIKFSKINSVTLIFLASITL